MREHASRLALAILLLGLTRAPVFADDPKDTPKQQLDKLLEAYKAYGLPLPPADAKLVRYEAFEEWVREGETVPASWGLAFRIRADKKGSEDQLLIGLLRWDTTWYKKQEIVEPKAELLLSLDPHQSDVATAIQCHARGWHALAEALLERHVKESDKDPQNELALAAWSHWTLDLSDPAVDWKQLTPRLKFLLDRKPAAFEGHHRDFLGSMELALQPSKAKPGSIEEILDRLVHERIEVGTGRVPPDNATYNKLATLGIQAVPTLLEHLDDQRLTRTVRTGFNNFPSWQLRMRHIVSDLLEDLAGYELETNWHRRQQGYTVDKTAVEAWWKKTRTVDEETYFVNHVLDKANDAIWPEFLMVQLITKKYPERLPELYRRMLMDRPKMESRPLVNAIMDSTLSPKVKRELLLLGADTKNLNHRCDALQKIKDIEPAVFDTTLIATLVAMAKSPTGHNLRIPFLVRWTTNHDVWAALRRTAEGCRAQSSAAIPGNNRRLCRRQRATYSPAATATGILGGLLGG